MPSEDELLRYKSWLIATDPLGNELKFKWDTTPTLEGRRAFLRAIDDCKIETVRNTWIVEAAMVVGIYPDTKSQVKADPPWIRIWNRASWAIPRSIRRTAFEPAFEDFRADYYRVSATTGGRCERGWMHIAFAVQFALMVLACLRMASINWITSGVMKVLRSANSSTDDARETIE